MRSLARITLQVERDPLVIALAGAVEFAGSGAAIVC
jgi:hypothetical protein